MEAVDLRAVVSAKLQHAPGKPLCDACLAFACGLHFATVHAVTAQLIATDPNFSQASACAGCRRLVASIAYRLRVEKCRHCSHPVDTTIDGMLMNGDAFHYHCLRKLISDDAIRVSRALGADSRRLIDESRRRIAQSLSQLMNPHHDDDTQTR